jgi:trigger factor
MPLSAEVTPLEENRVRLDVSVSGDEVKKATQRTIAKLGREVRVPGFRPGKVPAQVVVQRVGMDTVVQEMLKSSIAGWYADAVAEAGLDPIDDPDLDLDDIPEEGQELTFRATVQTRPRAVLGDYAGLEVGRAAVEVPEGAVDRELEALRDRAARLEPVDRAAEDKDFVVIDFDGSVNGQRLRSAAARDYLVQLGAGRLVEEFDTKLRGLKAGESVSFPVTYSAEDTRPELRGRTVDYTVTVKAVQAKVLPELNDDLALEVSEFDTLDELKADIYSKLEQVAEAQVDELFRRMAIDAVVKISKVDVPEIMVQRRVAAILQQTAQQLPQGMSLEDYFERSGRTAEQVVAELTPDAEMAVRRELVVEALAEAEGIEVTDADVEEQARADAEQMGRPFEEILHQLTHHGGFESLRQDIKLKRGVEKLVAAVTAIPMEQAEAREKLWTPGDARGETAGQSGKLWTPGQPQ